MSVYAATKAAMHSFSQALRVEARGSGVWVTELLPMSVKTPFFERATNRAEKPYAPGWKADTPESLAERMLRAARRPAAEVYTSSLIRLVLALDAVTPEILDRVLLGKLRGGRGQ